MASSSSVPDCSLTHPSIVPPYVRTDNRLHNTESPRAKLPRANVTTSLRARRPGVSRGPFAASSAGIFIGSADAESEMFAEVSALHAATSTGSIRQHRRRMVGASTEENHTHDADARCEPRYTGNLDWHVPSAPLTTERRDLV